MATEKDKEHFAKMARIKKDRLMSKRVAMWKAHNEYLRDWAARYSQAVRLTK